MAPETDKMKSCQCFTAVSKPVKEGYLFRYKKRFFGANWREEYAVLYEDSSLLWYKSRERRQPEGALMLRCAPELMAVGVFTRAVPRQPEFPCGTDIRRVIALGSSATRRVQWFICHSEDDAKAWMTAISNTLPAPPSPVAAEVCCPRAFSLPGHVTNSLDAQCADKRGTGEGRRSLDDLCSGLMLAGAVNEWCHGLGWGCAQGWGGPASAFDTGYYYSDAVGADADYDYEADFGDFGGDFGGF
ncbi:uncharacterized protein LOC122375279 [Amphibalanus amphitrite]|uniref:uncharacterized protein LOC122375279 n=1 Tax=Amphibalanus amphitrite TaxID=1232801 RepID=UPI001C8FDF31|nr:uncharacterized protein LOC122375279 [Amphibalanus amphitrite]